MTDAAEPPAEPTADSPTESAQPPAESANPEEVALDNAAESPSPAPGRRADGLPDDWIGDPPPRDLQKEATDESLPTSPDEWTTLEAKLRGPKDYIFETRLRASEVLRDAGNELFKQGDYSQATKCYERSLWHIDFEEMHVKIEFLPKHQQALARVKLPCHLNFAICLFKQIDDPTTRRLADAKEHCDDAIKARKLAPRDRAIVQLDREVRTCPLCRHPRV